MSIVENTSVQIKQTKKLVVLDFFFWSRSCEVRTHKYATTRPMKSTSKKEEVANKDVWLADALWSLGSAE